MASPFLRFQKPIRHVAPALGRGHAPSSLPTSPSTTHQVFPPVRKTLQEPYFRRVEVPAHRSGLFEPANDLLVKFNPPEGGVLGFGCQLVQRPREVSDSIWPSRIEVVAGCTTSRHIALTLPKLAIDASPRPDHASLTLVHGLANALAGFAEFGQVAATVSMSCETGDVQNSSRVRFMGNSSECNWYGEMRGSEKIFSREMRAHRAAHRSIRLQKNGTPIFQARNLALSCPLSVACLMNPLRSVGFCGGVPASAHASFLSAVSRVSRPPHASERNGLGSRSFGLNQERTRSSRLAAESVRRVRS